MIAPEHRGHLAWLGERRANALVGLEEDRGSSLGMTVHVLDDDPMIRKAMRGERNSEATTN